MDCGNPFTSFVQGIAMMGGGEKRTRKGKKDGKSPDEKQVLERKRKAANERNRRARRSQEKIEEDQLVDKVRKRDERSNRTQEKIEEDQLVDRVRKRDERSDCSPEKTAQRRKKDKAHKNNPTDRKKSRQRMGKIRSKKKQGDIEKLCSFDETKVYDVPGKDYYNDVEFENNPEVAVQLWYDNNGTWALRNAMWNTGFVHAQEYFLAEKGEIPSIMRHMRKTTVEKEWTLVAAVYKLMTKKDWKAQRKWQGEQGIDDRYMATFLWIASKGSKITKGLITKQLKQNPNSHSHIKVVDINWAKTLINLHLQVPNHWFISTTTGRHLKGNKPSTCVIVDINKDDKAEKFFFLKCIDDPEDPDHEVRYEMTYEGVKEYVDKKHPTFVDYEANLPLLQKLSSNHVDAGILKAWEDYTSKYEKLDPDDYDAIDKIQAELSEDEFLNVLKDQQAVTMEKQHEMRKKFYAKQGRGLPERNMNYCNGQSVDAPLYSCACCGHRDFDGTERDYKYVTLDEGLDILKLGNEDWIANRDRQQHDDGSKLELPNNEAGGKETFPTWKAVSLYPQDDRVIKDMNMACHEKLRYDVACDSEKVEHGEFGTLSCSSSDGDLLSDMEVSSTGDDDDPTSTNIDLSTPGAFTKGSCCTRKGCMDAECSNESEIQSPPRVKSTRKSLSCLSNIINTSPNASRKVEQYEKYDPMLFEDGCCDENCPPPDPITGRKRCTQNHGKRAKYFHLHPEFVETYTKNNKKISIKAMICNECRESIGNKLIPGLSIASGVDLGDYRRVGLTPLTFRERHIISKVRHYINVIKIETNKGTGNAKKSGHSTLKGCAIMMDHDSPQRVAKSVFTIVENSKGSGDCKIFCLSICPKNGVVSGIFLRWVSFYAIT